MIREPSTYSPSLSKMTASTTCQHCPAMNHSSASGFAAISSTGFNAGAFSEALPRWKTQTTGGKKWWTGHLKVPGNVGELNCNALPDLQRRSQGGREVAPMRSLLHGRALPLRTGDA